MLLEVNPNTVARSYDFLKQQNIIYDKRGIGYFITIDGVKNAAGYRRQEFVEKEMPLFFRNMFLLGIEPEDLKQKYEKFKKIFLNESNVAYYQNVCPPIKEPFDRSNPADIKNILMKTSNKLLILLLVLVFSLPLVLMMSFKAAIKMSTILLKTPTATIMCQQALYSRLNS